MNESLVIPLAIAAGILVSVIVAYRRRNRDLRQYLEPALHELGFEYISAVSPKGPFKVGPFPKIEFEAGRPTSHIGAISGEYLEYKIVRFRDKKGNQHELWALVEFEIFKLRRVR